MLHPHTKYILILRPSEFSSLAGLMTARFLLHLREWDHRISNSQTDQWHTRGGGDQGPIQFKKREPSTTQWTINDVLGDDPLLRPLGMEVGTGDESLEEASTSRMGL